ncbi:DNA repair protein XRCC2-like [Achroia grisella]|uniref:DNA repair protein XRCC2-like n=1 Tax=Achroia grisella TaxID=688607 RepID=UPI0027D1F46E|nr:DNA repair protein XRCC2-like [Achroia grisella]
MDRNQIKVESGVQLLARLTKKTEIEGFYPVLFNSGPKFNEVIEMLSNISMSTLLIDMICEALLPIRLGGSQLSVLIFNTDGDLNYDALIKCLRKKICSCLSYEPSEIYNTEQFKSLFNETICNLHILEIYDATQFYTTMYNLENILTEHSDISLVIIDTLTAFYWSEQGYKITKMDLYLRNLLQIIRKVMKDYKITVLYTRPEYFTSNKDTTEKFERYNFDPTMEGVDYHIQLTFDNSIYNLTVVTSEFNIKRHFTMLDNTIHWMLEQ